MQKSVPVPLVSKASVALGPPLIVASACHIPNPKSPNEKGLKESLKMASSPPHLILRQRTRRVHRDVLSDSGGIADVASGRVRQTRVPDHEVPGLGWDSPRLGAEQDLLGGVLTLQAQALCQKKDGEIACEITSNGRLPVDVALICSIWFGRTSSGSVSSHEST